MSSLSNSIVTARDYDYSLKLVLVGDPGVGKTTFVNTFIDGKYAVYVSQDICGIKEKLLQHNDSQVRLQIWDTAGQERYRSLTASYYRGSHGCLVVFDLTNKSSFENVTRWRRDILQYCDRDNIDIILVGTKCHKPNREVPQGRAEDLARSVEMPYMEVSCETDLGSVDAVFTKMVDMVVSRGNLARATSFSDKRRLGKPREKTWCSC